VGEPEKFCPQGRCRREENPVGQGRRPRQSDRQLCSVLKQVIAPDPKYSAYIEFIQGITGGGFGVHVTACAYGTEFEVRPEGFVRFRKISLGHGIENPLHLESSVPFEAQDIHDLVVNLIV
jgi:hypothetical protein